MYTGDSTHLYTHPKLASRGITLLQDILLKKIEPLRFLTVGNRLSIMYTGDSTHLYTHPKLASRGITLLQDILLKKRKWFLGPSSLSILFKINIEKEIKTIHIYVL